MSKPSKPSPAKNPARASTSHADLVSGAASPLRGGSGVKTRPQSTMGGVAVRTSGDVPTVKGGVKGAVATNQGPRTPGVKGVGLKELRWRVDVTISTSSMERVLKPAILLEMTLTDGRILTFLVPPHRLNEFRYNVARVLKEIHTLQLKN